MILCSWCFFATMISPFKMFDSSWYSCSGECSSSEENSLLHSSTTPSKLDTWSFVLLWVVELLAGGLADLNRWPSSREVSGLMLSSLMILFLPLFKTANDGYPLFWGASLGLLWVGFYGLDLVKPRPPREMDWIDLTLLIKYWTVLKVGCFL